MHTGSARLFISVLATALLLLTAPMAVEAQQFDTQQEPRRLAYDQPMVKEYGQEGVPKMTVFVWGNADSGVWRVEEGTDLLEFLSVVSRLQMRDRSPDRRMIQTLAIYREENPREGDPFFESQIENLFSGRNNYPALQEGDILLLEAEAQNRFTWRDIAQVAGTIATVLNTYLLIQRIR